MTQSKENIYIEWKLNTEVLFNFDEQNHSDIIMFLLKL